MTSKTESTRAKFSVQDPPKKSGDRAGEEVARTPSALCIVKLFRLSRTSYRVTAICHRQLRYRRGFFHASNVSLKTTEAGSQRSPPLQVRLTKKGDDHPWPEAALLKNRQLS